MDLIEQARTEHREFEPGRGVGCRECYQPGIAVDWPCLPLQLAEQLAASEARVVRLEAGLKAMEFRKEMSVAGTVNEFCPVCHGGPCQIPLNPQRAATNGHRHDCPLYALIATAEAQS